MQKRKNKQVQLHKGTEEKVVGLKLETTNQFEKDVILANNQGKDMDLLFDVIEKLCSKQNLDAKYKVHPLEPKSKGLWELHIKPNWLLVYKPFKDKIILMNTGSHNHIFG